MEEKDGVDDHLKNICASASSKVYSMFLTYNIH